MVQESVQEGSVAYPAEPLCAGGQRGSALTVPGFLILRRKAGGGDETTVDSLARSRHS